MILVKNSGGADRADHLYRARQPTSSEMRLNDDLLLFGPNDRRYGERFGYAAYGYYRRT